MGLKIVVIGGGSSYTPEYLPQFAEVIAKRKKEGIFCEDSVVQNLMKAGH